MYDIEAEELFCRVISYTLFREDETIYVIAIERLQGEVVDDGGAKFLASPTKIPGSTKHMSEKHMGRGATEIEAVNDCLERIKGLNWDQIFSDENE